MFAGSCAEYSWGGHCVEGDSLEHPATLYGQSKKSFSDYLVKQGAKENVSICIGRVFFLFGPGEPLSRLVPSVISAQLQGQPVRVSDGNQLRDFMFVGDGAAALVALVNSNAQGVINIASGSPMPIKNLINQISAVLMPKSDVCSGAVPRAPNDPDILTAGTKRLNEEVGFRPEISLKTGLELTADWIRQKLRS